MEKNDVANALRGLADSDTGRSDTARLRDVFDDVEAALSSGVTRAAILEALHGQGFKMTFKSFESALHRIRKERRNEQKTITPKREMSSQPSNTAAAQTTPKDKPLAKKKRTRIHDPSTDVTDLLTTD